MKVLIYSPFALSPSHHEFSLEMAKLHLEKGDEVHALICSGSIQTCDQNVNHERIRCLQCKSIGTKTFLQMGVPKANIHFLPENMVTNRFKGITFQSLNELQNYHWQGVPIGYAVCSSLVTGTRDTKPDIKKFSNFITWSMDAYASVYDGVSKIMKETGAHLLYVFNGRTTLYQAAFQAARALDKTVLVGEREIEDRYVIYENTHSLDLENYKVEFARVSELIAETPNWKAIGQAWFENCSKGKGDFSSNYISHQKAGALPFQFDKCKFNIVIFSSSEDEIIIEPSLKLKVFETQNQGIQYLLDNVKDPNTHIYLRLHPNLRGLDVTQTRETKLLKGENFTCIPAEASIDSYALLDAADTVITFGSTLTVEAVYRNKPVILLGRNIFEDLGVFYIPKTKEELLKLVTTRLKPFPPESVLPYAFWRAIRGTKFRYITTQNPHLGNPSLFNGDKLFVPGFFVRLVLKFYRDLFRLLRWVHPRRTSS